MTMEALVEFMGKLDKRTDAAHFEASKKKMSAAAATPGNKGAEDMAATVHMLVDVGKQKGYTFSEADVKAYLDQMKTLYYTSSPVKVLMDAFCTTSCHIGSQIQKS
ncbi:MAG TPA: hypothetical protein VG889_03590 [Rhizomicrobium sp.]|nr:hypothetical protein [Rhizomicrobium sp.]